MCRVDLSKALRLLNISKKQARDSVLLKSVFHKAIRSVHPDSSTAANTTIPTPVHKTNDISSLTDAYRTICNNAHLLNDNDMSPDSTKSANLDEWPSINGDISGGNLDWGGQWWAMEFYKDSLAPPTSNSPQPPLNDSLPTPKDIK